MPNSCAAYGCNNRFGPDSQHKKITFHQLPPPGEARRKLWIANSRRIDPVTRKPWDPSFKYIYFCSDHFTPSDYEICGKTMGRRLKANAVPTVFTFPTVVPPDPQEEGSAQAGDSANPAADEKGKHSRPGKPRNRKVVMLPKKIKLLQDAGESDVESVTIISFQHLNYDEKLQPIFEEAMIDLQYPEEEEYFDEDYDVEDEYTESNDSPLVKDEKPPQSEEDNANENSVEEDENMDCSNDVISQPTGTEYENNDQSNNENEDFATADIDDNRKDCSIVEGSFGSNENKYNEGQAGVSQNKRNRSQPEDYASVSQKSPNIAEPKEHAGVSQKRTNSSIQPEPGKQELNKVEDSIPKRKVPVVVKEISGIKDIEELRIKSFKIAEDNIMLKRQVIYLERKLQEIVSQLYEK